MGARAVVDRGRIVKVNRVQCRNRKKGFVAKRGEE